MKTKFNNTLLKKYKNEIISFFMTQGNSMNIMAVPRLEKIVINRGIGDAVTDSKLVDITYNQILIISGQKPVITKAKKWKNYCLRSQYER